MVGVVILGFIGVWSVAFVPEWLDRRRDRINADMVALARAVGVITGLRRYERSRRPNPE